jgi:two-component system cell cycle sensor histidine kinase/response regulator CckA
MAPLTLGEDATQLGRLLDGFRGIVYVYDLVQARNLFISARWSEDFGYSIAETQAEGAAFLARILHPDDLATVRDHHAALAADPTEQGRTIEFRVRQKDGTYVWMSSHDRPFARDAAGRVTQIFGFGHDITRQKAAEVERAETAARFRAIVEHLPDAVIVADERGAILQVNPAAGTQLGYTPEELLQKRVSELVPPELASRVRERLESAPSSVTSRRSVHVRKDGTRVPVETTVVPIQLGGARAFLGVARDLSDREATAIRMEHEAALRGAIIENAVEGICVCEEIAEAPGIFFTVWNRRMTEISGYTLDEINRMGWYQTVYTDPETQARAADRMERMRRGEDLEAERWTITRKDGAHRTLLISTRVLLDAANRPKVLGVMHDLTDQIRLEDQLREAQRMEAIGRLAGAVAHDFNNILAGVLAGAALLRDTAALAPADRDTADDIVTAATRGADLTRQLLTFGRRQRTEMRPLDLGALAERALRGIERLLDRSVTVKTVFSPDCHVVGDAAMLDQVLMNLTLNARDAMPEGGVLAVTIQPVGEKVHLRVSDTGGGVPSAALPHIFEPFFTTKAGGKGTGLGLATVYAVVTQHGGSVTVERTSNQGTTFLVVLPRSAAPSKAAPSAAGSAATTTPPPGRTILLVEDQPLVRRALQRLLEVRGHRVLEAGTIPEALGLWERHRPEIQLLLSDVALGPVELGGGSGPELAARLLRDRPDLPVVYMSGFDPALSSLPLTEGHDFLAKPITPEAIDALLARRFGG